MNHVNAITKQSDINKMAEYLKEKNMRDYILFEIGINLGIKVSDYADKTVGYFREICNKGRIEEIKGKVNSTVNFEQSEQAGQAGQIEQSGYTLILSPSLISEIEDYIKFKDDNEYMFPSQKGGTPITRQHICRVLDEAGQYAGINGHVGTISLRKTFGYWYYKYSNNIHQLMRIYNHKKPETTLEFIGIKMDKPTVLELGLEKD